MVGAAVWVVILWAAGFVCGCRWLDWAVSSGFVAPRDRSVEHPCPACGSQVPFEVVLAPRPETTPKDLPGAERRRRVVGRATRDVTPDTGTLESKE